MAPEEKFVNWTKLSSSLISLWPTVPIFILPPGLTVELIELIVVNFVEPAAVLATVPILMLPLGVTEVVIEVMVLNFFVPSAVLLAVAP